MGEMEWAATPTKHLAKQGLRHSRTITPDPPHPTSLVADKTEEPGAVVLGF